MRSVVTRARSARHRASLPLVWLLALSPLVALAFAAPRLRAQEAPQEDGKQEGGTTDGKPDDSSAAPKTPESPNTQLPPSASSTLTKAIEAFKAAYARVYKEGYQKAKADLQEAVKLLKRAREEDMSTPLPLYYLGILDQLEGNDRHAIENLNVVVRLNPKFWEAWTELGDAHAHLGEVKDAESCYAKALELKPDHVEAYLGRALERLDDGRFKDALKDARHGAKLSPGNLWFLSIAAKAKMALDGPGWRNSFTKETDHYVVKTDVDQPYADWIAGQAELIRKLYVRVFEKCQVSLPKRKYTVFVFGSKEEYLAAGSPQGTAGYYDPSVRQLFLYKGPDPSYTLTVLYHEGFHQFLHPILPRAPQWFNEGFGDYFGAARYVKTPREGMEMHPSSWRLPEVKAGISSGRVKPLRELLHMSQAELYDKASVSMNYAQSWSFIYFLCEYNGREYFPLLGKYFSALRAGKDLAEAYKSAFGDQDMEKIDKEWRTFIEKL